MNAKSLIRALKSNMSKIKAVVGKPHTQESGDLAINILVGCGQAIAESGGDFKSWMNRQPERFRYLHKIQRRYRFKAGNRILCDLIEYTISCVQACAWVDDYSLGALPALEPRNLTDEQMSAWHAGRDAHRASEASRKAKLEAARLKRLFGR